jgi:hypothetical protein
MEAAKFVKVAPNPMFIAGVICLSIGGVLFIVSGCRGREGGRGSCKATQEQQLRHISAHLLGCMVECTAVAAATLIASYNRLLYSMHDSGR